MKQPNGLPKWLYDFASPPGKIESSCCCTFLSAFGIVTALDFDHFNSCVWYTIVVFTFVYLFHFCLLLLCIYYTVKFSYFLPTCFHKSHAWLMWKKGNSLLSTSDSHLFHAAIRDPKLIVSYTGLEIRILSPLFMSVPPIIFQSHPTQA